MPDSSALPPPEASMPPEGQPTGTLPILPNPLAALGQMRLAFREGPLAGRIFRRALPVALGGAVAAVMSDGPALVLTVWSSEGSPLIDAFMTIVAVLGFALESALILVGPLWMGWWASRRFLAEGQLAGSPSIPAEARGRAVLSASALLACVAIAPNLLAEPVLDMVELRSESTFPAPNVASLAGGVFVFLLAQLTDSVALAMFMATGSLMAMRLGCASGVRRGRKVVAYLAFVGATIAGWFIAWFIAALGIAGTFIALLGTRKHWPWQPPPDIDSAMYWLLVGQELLGSLVTLLVLAWIYRWFWRRDLPLVLAQCEE